MDELAELRAENERLRELLWDHDIDPDPAPPPPPQFGPPTEFEWRMAQMFAKATAHLADAVARQVTDASFLSGLEWADGKPLRIRLPNDFTVRS